MGRLLKTLLAGLVAGTALGIMISPKKGKEIREGFKKELEDGGSGLETVKQTISDMGKDFGGTAKRTGEKIKKSPRYKKGKAKVKKFVKKTTGSLKRRVSKK